MKPMTAKAPTKEFTPTNVHIAITWKKLRTSVGIYQSCDNPITYEFYFEIALVYLVTLAARPDPNHPLQCILVSNVMSIFKDGVGETKLNFKSQIDLKV